MRSISIIIIIILASIQTVMGQDPVFSQAIWNDIQLNPALAGTHKKDNRLFGIYRDQWRQAPVPYMTVNASYDRKLLLNGGDKHRLGIGGQFLYDRAGTAALSQINVEGILSYTLLLNSMKQRISIGLGAGINNRSIDASKLIFGPDGNPGGGEVFSSDNWMTPRLSGGINFYSELKKAGELDLGFSLFNPHQPEGSFVNTPSKQISRFNTYGRFTFNLGEDWKLQPGLVYSRQGEYQQGTNTLLARYQIKEVGLWFGPGYRWGDAVIGYVGMDIADIRFGFSYDQNISDFKQATNGIGAFEMSLTYAWSKKKDEPEPEEFDVTPPIAEEEEEEEEATPVTEVTEEVEQIIVDRVDVVKEEPAPQPVPFASLSGRKITFYFDNNTPGMYNTNDYKQLYDLYLQRQAVYEKAYPETSTFFNDKLKGEFAKFEVLATELAEALAAGKQINVSMKGFASNLGPAKYNEQLSAKRIESIKDYMLNYNNGVLKKYVDNGQLSFSSAPLGATNSVIKATDDKKTAIFSPTASEERKVELTVEVVK